MAAAPRPSRSSRTWTSVSLVFRFRTARRAGGRLGTDRAERALDRCEEPIVLCRRADRRAQAVVGAGPHRDIADELSISARTASNHVSRVLSKTPTANRTEAATYALRHSLA